MVLNVEVLNLMGHINDKSHLYTSWTNVNNSNYSDGTELF